MVTGPLTAAGLVLMVMVFPMILRIRGELSFPEVVAEQRRGPAAFYGLVFSEVAAQHWDDAKCGEEIAGDFNGVKLLGLANARKFVLQRVVEGLECGDGLEGLIVALELAIDVDGIGLGGEAAGRADFGIEAFSGGEPHELLRLRER